MAITGSGVALSIGYSLLIYDGDGNLVAQVTKPQPTGYISSPVAAADGSVFFADASNAYRVDRTGRPIWQTPLGGNATGQEFGAPQAPALDPAGRLHVSALDGKLWTFRGEDGQVLASAGLASEGRAPLADDGLRQGPRRRSGWHCRSRFQRQGRRAVCARHRLVGRRGDGGRRNGWALRHWRIRDWRRRQPHQQHHADAETISIYDKCGNARWRVPVEATRAARSASTTIFSFWIRCRRWWREYLFAPQVVEGRRPPRRARCRVRQTLRPRLPRRRRHVLLHKLGFGWLPAAGVRLRASGEIGDSLPPLPRCRNLRRWWEAVHCTGAGWKARRSPDDEPGTRPSELCAGWPRCSRNEVARALSGRGWMQH